MPNESILLLDTEKNVLLAYQTILEEEGYLVSIAGSNQEALDKMNSHNYEVLITELHLKGENSINLLKRLKREHPNLYVIMITATTMKPESYDAIITAGVDDYFTKPLSPALLLVTIKKGLKRRSLVEKNTLLEKKLQTMEVSIPSNCRTEHIKEIHSIHSFSNKLQNEIVRSKRYKHKFSLLICNMHYSDNEACDADGNLDISNELFQILETTTRKTDILTKYNGNFLFILVETSEAGTKTFANRLQKEISNVQCDKLLSHHLTKTMNIDYFAFPEQSDSICKWIESTEGN